MTTFRSVHELTAIAASHLEAAGIADSRGDAVAHALSEVEELCVAADALAVCCPICDAQPEQPCENRITGRKARVPHPCRLMVAAEESLRTAVRNAEDAQ